MHFYLRLSFHDLILVFISSCIISLLAQPKLILFNPGRLLNKL